MLSSFKTLFQSPFNQINPVSALYRFFLWKAIRFFKIRNYNYLFWGDRKISLDYRSFHAMWLMYNSWVDWPEFNLIKNYVREGNIVVDVGANIGYYSLWMSKFVGTEGKVYSFEPDETNYKLFEKNININELTSIVSPIKKAVSNIPGNNYFTTGLDGENHITINKDIDSIQVLTITLENFFLENKIDQIVFLKIDVEGFELNVLQGCGKFLTNKKIEIIQFEINQRIQNSGCSVSDINEFLQQNNYSLCSYDVKSNTLIPVLYSVVVENYFAVSNLERANEKLCNTISEFNQETLKV